MDEKEKKDSAADDKKETERIEELKKEIEKGVDPKDAKDDEPFNNLEPQKKETKSSPAKASEKEASPEDVEKRKKLILWGSVGIIAVLVAVAMIAAVLSNPADDNSITTPILKPSNNLPSATPVPVSQASNLDGVVVTTELATRHPLAVMIENSTLARPQSGLGDASIVYEAITEGGITRFMALFGHTLPEKVGPVRSARAVFVELAQEYGPNSAYYAHVGGSPEALSMIKQDSVFDLDQFAVGSQAYQRFPKAGVAIEHTMYGFPAKLLQYVKSKNWRSDAEFKSWKFKSDTAIANRPESQNITIPFSSASYEVKYAYDKVTNSYKRYLAGSEHKDANTGKQLSPKNVIIQFANYATTDEKGRQDVTITGSGAAKVLVDGKVTEAKWAKANKKARTIFTDAATGQEIELNAGQVWVEIVKTGTTITVQ